MQFRNNKAITQRVWISALALEKAIRQGVEIFVARARVTPEDITFDRLLPIRV